MRSRELQTKKKVKIIEKGGPEEVSGPIEERPEAVDGPTGEGSGQAEEVEEVVKRLMCKRRRLVKAGQVESLQGGTATEAAKPSEEGGVGCCEPE